MLIICLIWLAIISLAPLLEQKTRRAVQTWLSPHLSGAADRPSLANDMRDPNNEGYLLQPSSFNDAIDVFDLILFAGTPVHCEVRS